MRLHRVIEAYNQAVAPPDDKKIGQSTEQQEKKEPESWQKLIR